MAIRKTKEQFVKEATEKHCGKYTYEHFIYTNALYKGLITCPIHGDFLQTPHEHLKGQGCPKCKNESTGNRLRHTKEYFVDEANKIHKGFYSYDKFVYTNSQTKGIITCPIHGDFLQVPCSHLQGHGCPECHHDKKRLTYEDFVKKANKKHLNRYDYPYFKYKNNLEYIDIVCKKHGIFKQSIKTHLAGCGCPQCMKSSLEDNVEKQLIEYNIFYEKQKSFEWLRNIYPLKLDFFLLDFNIGIECQGRQHFMPIEYFGGESRYEKMRELDNLKKQLCENHGIKIFYYSTKKETCGLKSLDNIIYDIKNIISENQK